MTKFNIGDRVVLPKASNLQTYNTEMDDCTRGQIIDTFDDGKFSVKWDSSWRKPNPSTHSADDLMTEAEANEIISKLEKEYEAWAAPVREKMEQVGKLLSEASDLAEAQNQNLVELYDLIDPLLSAMRSLGWRTSSLSC